MRAGRFSQYSNHMHGLQHMGFAGDEQQPFDLRQACRVSELDARGRTDERNFAEIDEGVKCGGVRLSIPTQRIHPPPRIILVDFSVQTD